MPAAEGWSTTTPLLPMVGMVVTISPSLSLYRMVVLPAASSPTYKNTMSARGSCLLPTARFAMAGSLLNAHHQDPHLLLGYKPVEELGDGETHVC